MFNRFIIFLLISFSSWLLGLYAPFMSTLHGEANSQVIDQLPLYTFHELLSNNLMVVLNNILSFFLLSIPAMLNMFSNGFALGVTLKGALADTSLLREKIIMLVFPHAVFEFISLLLSAIISMEICFQLIRPFFVTNHIKFCAKESIIIKLIVISFLLTFISTWIESQFSFKQI